MWVYQQVSVFGLGFNMLLLVLVGLLVNGPYALITTAVSAELGTHRSLEGNSKALATVTAIIDGTGSIGKFKLKLFTSIATIIACCCFFFGSSYSIVFQVLQWVP